MRVVGRGHVDYYVPFEFGEKNKSAATRNTPSQTDAERTDEACTHQNCSYVRCFGRAVPSFGSKYGVVLVVVPSHGSTVRITTMYCNPRQHTCL